MIELDEERGSYGVSAQAQSLTRRIIQIFYDVYNALGYGFLEKVYECLRRAAQAHGLQVQQQRPISVFFDGCISTWWYFADLVVNDIVLLELKAASEISPGHAAQR